MKTCSKCNLIKDVLEFSKSASHKDRLTSHCKSCQAEKRVRERKNPELIVRKFPVRTDGLKKCGVCHKEKPVSEFNIQLLSPDGLQRPCRGCEKIYRTVNGDRIKKQRDRNPERQSDLGRRSKYGMPIGEYARLKSEQGGLCAVCGGSGKRLVVDHDHQTGKIRGLICYGCNIDIRILDGSPLRIIAAMKYLNKYLTISIEEVAATRPASEIGLIVREILGQGAREVVITLKQQ